MSDKKADNKPELEETKAVEGNETQLIKTLAEKEEIIEQAIAETVEEPKAEEPKQDVATEPKEEETKEPKANEKKELISKDDVLNLLNKTNVQIVKRFGNTITVPSREIRALVNGLIEDVKKL